MVYKDLGVKINGRDLNTATDISVDYPSQTSAKRKLGENMNAADQFNFDGPSEVSISVGFLIEGDAQGLDDLGSGLEDISEYSFLFDDDQGNDKGGNTFEVGVGGQTFSGCYINNYSVQVSPFQPVKGTANFTSYEPPRGGSITASSNSIDARANKIINGHTCAISNASQAVSANVISDYKYTKTFQRTPVYRLGDENSSSFLIDSVVADISISSTGLVDLINSSGKEIVNPMSLTLRNSDGDGVFSAGGELTYTVPSGSRIIGESYNVNGGETIGANARIQNVIL